MEHEKRSVFKLSLPWKKYTDLEHCVFGVVSDISYHCGSPNWCEMQLHIASRDDLDAARDGQHSRLAKGKSVSICFYEKAGLPNFVILYSLFKWGVSRRFRASERVKAAYSPTEVFDARVVALQVDARLLDLKPWRCYLIDWYLFPA